MPVSEVPQHSEYNDKLYTI